MEPLTDIHFMYEHQEWLVDESGKLIKGPGEPHPSFRFYHYTPRDPATWIEKSVKGHSYWTPVRTESSFHAGEATGIGGPICKWRIDVSVDLAELVELNVVQGGFRRTANANTFEYKILEAVPLSRCIVTKMDAT